MLSQPLCACLLKHVAMWPLPHAGSAAKTICLIQVAKKISKLILPDDLSVNIEHKTWHGKQPTTLTAVTLYIATHLGSRVMSPGVPIRTISEVCHILLAPVQTTACRLYLGCVHMAWQSLCVIRLHASRHSRGCQPLRSVKYVAGRILILLCNHLKPGVNWICR